MDLTKRTLPMNTARPVSASEAPFFHAAHAAQLMRSALQRELESELRGLIMAARLHGFRLVVEGEAMSYCAIDSQLSRAN